MSPNPGRGHSVRHDVADQLRVSGVSYEASLPPLSALSPTSFVFSFLRLTLDLCLCTLLLLLFLLARLFVLLPLFLPLFILPLLLLFPLLVLLRPLLFPLFLTLLVLLSFLLLWGFRPLLLLLVFLFFLLVFLLIRLPLLPPGFPPHSSSSSLVSSFSTPLSLLSSSLSSSFLPSSVSSSSSAIASAPVSSAPIVSSASSSSSSSLDYASYKAHVLGILDEYLSLARFYVSVGGLDFFFLSSYCPHLLADVAKDFASGSSVLLSTLRSSSVFVSGPPASTPGALLPPLFSSAVPSGGVVSSGDPRGVEVAPAAPVSSAGSLSSFLSGLDSLAGPPPLLALPLSSSSLPPPSLSRSGGASGFAAVADPVPSAVPAFAPLVSSSLFRPFDASSAGPSSVVPPPPSSLPPHDSSPLFGSAPLSGVPPPPAALLGSSFSSVAPSHPDPSFPDDSAFYPDFADPSAQGPEPPLAPPVPDSVCVEIRRMYSYVVDLFPQAAGSPAAPPPPRALLEDLFVASSSSPHQPVFLDWFARVRTSLSEADARLASLLASGLPDSSLLPQHMSQYAVHGDFASSSAVPVNPSLLSMFECSLRPSLQLSISLREAALKESSSRFHSEALSHSLWLLSALLAFVCLQGFSLADASLFNTCHFSF